MISGKYFCLESDPRFPLTLPNCWQNLNSDSFDTPKTLSIYLLSGHNTLYVGSDSYGNRPVNHRNDFRRTGHANHYMQAVVNKHGLESFCYATICSVPQEYLQYRDQIENSYIKHFDTFRNGYNLCEFADTSFLGRKHSEESKRIISEKAKHRLATNNPLKGRARPSEVITRMAASMKGKLAGKKNPNFGKKHTEKILSKMRGPRPSMQGQNHPRYGVELSEKSKDEMSKMRTHPFYILSPEGKLTHVESLRTFCAQHNLHSSGVYAVLRGRLTHYRGWRKAFEIRDLTQEELCVRKERDKKNWGDKVAKEFWFYKDEAIIKIVNLKRYCETNNLSYQSMFFTYHGTNRHKSHKGYSSAKADQQVELGVKTINAVV